MIDGINCRGSICLEAVIIYQIESATSSLIDSMLWIGALSEFLFEV